MRYKTFATLAILLALATPRSAHGQLTADEVRDSIDRAVAYLKRQQKAGGTWPEHAAYEGGVTSLCTLALLNAGVPLDDDNVSRALAYLRSLRPRQTYVVSLQTMVFCAARPKQHLLLIQRNVKWLESTQFRAGPFRGGWSYPSAGNGGMPDPSNSQFALLALYEAERAGAKVNPSTWDLALNYWTALQNPDGSWAYRPDSDGTGSMTCAGITSAIIAAGRANSGDAKVVGNRVECCAEQSTDKMVDDGLAWLARNFSVHVNPGVAGRRRALAGASRANLLYYLYGLERVGRMTARRFIGDHDWYREGSDMLVRAQDNLAGYWKGGGHAEDNPVIATSFALLFLAKGRRPVLAAKLRHEPGNDWNNHRNDLANLTHYVETLWERDLTWQVVDAEAATVEDLLQAPVLFISGREAPRFTGEEKRRLRDYVDRGGFLFAEGCCDGTGFDQGFRALMDEIFPEPDYKLRLLPPEHPIWRVEEPVDPKYARPLWGIDVGCRTSVIFCPDDLSCYWELDQNGRRDRLPLAVRDEVDACLAIGANVMAYATNREVKFKNEFFDTASTSAPQDNFERGKLYTARLQHPGGCNAAPGALGNLMQLASEKLQLRVSTEPRELSMADPEIFRYHLVFMHGRHTFRLTPAERKQLRIYLERGGMLVADAICSSRAFSDAFAREMAELFPEHKLERIPPDHPIFGTDFGGDDLDQVERRVPQRAGNGPLESLVRLGEPYLEGIKLGDRYAVIFSPYDLSCALENHQSLECEGYTRKDAGRIGLNILLYSFHQ
ncbi:MAG: DUF4159 domain-containing protein [Planctomycetota bacterium]|nr:MAG: DUF4159 domain-containing protein [Planctomycetota bacterium]